MSDKTPIGSEKMTVAFRTLGCKQNQYDTDYLKGTFRERGYRVLDDNRSAEGVPDLVVVNTCAVTSKSAAKCRQAIRAAIRKGSKVLVTGCYSQIASDEIASIPGVAVVAGVRGRGRLAALADQLMTSQSMAGPPTIVVTPHEEGEVFEETPVPSPSLTRAFMKIQEGCGDYCSYCIVPYARGPSRSRAPSAVLEEARSLVARGFKEIVLTGTHLGLYEGADGDGQRAVDLPGIIARICEVKGLLRLRVSSLEPHDVTEALIDCLRLPQVCAHLHLPLQSGSDSILARMGRRYNSDQFLKIVKDVRSVVPTVGLTTDIIVGFPGETEHDFRATLQVAGKAGFSRIHAFKFSSRPGTRAAKFQDKVPDSEKDARASRLISFGRELSETFHSKHVGREIEVLVEDDPGPNGTLTGLTRNYVRAYAVGDASSRGKLVQMTVVGLAGDGVLCRI